MYITKEHANSGDQKVNSSFFARKEKVLKPETVVETQMNDPKNVYHAICKVCNISYLMSSPLAQ